MIVRPLLLAACLIAYSAAPASAQFHGLIYPAPTASLSLDGLPAGIRLMPFAAADPAP